MALGASHTIPSEPRSPVFVGRRREMQILENALWSPQSPSEYRVISLFGIGGQGKTSTLVHFRKRLMESDSVDIPVASLDFEEADQRQPVIAMILCRNAMRRQGVHTHAFDIAFARYYALSRPSRDIRIDYPELFSVESGILGDIVDICGGIFLDIPGGSLIQKFLYRMGTEITDWYHSNKSTILEEIDKRDAAQIREDLPMFFGYDLHQHLLKKGNHRPIIIVDGYEALWAGHPAGAASDQADFWLRRLVEESPGCLFIICGRRPARWTRVDQDWEDVIRHHEIPALSDEDVDALLDNSKINCEAIRNKIRTSAEGHPLSLALQTLTFQKIVAKGRIPTVEDFALLKKDIIDRFFNHLGSEFRVIYRIIAIPRKFERQTWLFLQQSGKLPLGIHGYDEIIEEAFFQGEDRNAMVMHSIVREHLMLDFERADPELLREVKLTYFDHYDHLSGRTDGDYQFHWREEETVPDVERPAEAALGGNNSIATRDALLEQASELLISARPEIYSEWCIQRLTTDLSERGPRIRNKFLKDAIELSNGEVDQKIQLAHLCAAGDPFSGLCEDLLETADLSFVTVDDKSKEYLETLVENLSMGYRKLKFSSTKFDEIFKTIREDSDAHLLMALQAKDEPAILRNFQSRTDSGRGGPGIGLVFQAAALLNDRSIVDAANTSTDFKGSMKNANACHIVSCANLFGRPRWGIDVVKQKWSIRDDDQFVEVIQRNDGSYAFFLKSLIAEAYAKAGEHEIAIKIISYGCPQQQFDELLHVISGNVDFPYNGFDTARDYFENHPCRFFGHALQKLGHRSDILASYDRMGIVLHNLEFVVSDKQDLYLFFKDPSLFFRASENFIVCSDDGLQFGFCDLSVGWVTSPVSPDFAKHLSGGSKCFLVLMDDQNTPLAGGPCSVFSVDASRFHHIGEEVSAAASDFRGGFPLRSDSED